MHKGEYERLTKRIEELTHDAAVLLSFGHYEDAAKLQAECCKLCGERDTLSLFECLP